MLLGNAKWPIYALNFSSEWVSVSVSTLIFPLKVPLPKLDKGFVIDGYFGTGTLSVAKVGYNGTLGSILLFFKRTFSKMLQINGTVPFLLMLREHLVCAIFFSNVCAFCPI